MKKNLLQYVPIPLTLMLFAVLGQTVAFAEKTERSAAQTEADLPDETAQASTQNYRLFASTRTDTPEKQRGQTEPVYPLFRAHSERYYPERDVQKATRLSLMMPGLGQAYAGNYGKASFFLVTELGTFALAGYHLARALHYDKQDRFETGFHDPRLDEFLTAAQARVRMRNHSLFSGIFLVTGIGLHLWNVFDASKTTEAANNRRFSVQMQQKDNGMHSVVWTHRF